MFITIGDDLYPILYPLLIIYVIKKDSIFWRNIYITLSNTTRMSKILKNSKHGKELKKQLLIQSSKYNSLSKNLNNSNKTPSLSNIYNNITSLHIQLDMVQLH